MHIPMRVDYGIRALVDLGEHSDDGPVRASEVAKRQGIPEPFLARVLHTLHRHGLTESQRGPQGGHSLAMDASEITMGMVMRHLEGPLHLVTCLDDTRSCEKSFNCGQQGIWRDVEEAMSRVLDSTSIADLVERGRFMKKGLSETLPIV